MSEEPQLSPEARMLNGSPTAERIVAENTHLRAENLQLLKRNVELAARVATALLRDEDRPKDMAFRERLRDHVNTVEKYVTVSVDDVLDLLYLVTRQEKQIRALRQMLVLPKTELDLILERVCRVTLSSF